MSLKAQTDCLKRMVDELNGVGIPITGVYMPSSDTDAGLEIDSKYILQIAPYHTPQFVLDRVELPGEEVASFTNIDQLIQYLMEF